MYFYGSTNHKNSNIMATYNMTTDFQEQLDDINQKMKQAHSEGAALFATKTEADSFWDYLKACEQPLITNTLHTQAYNHDMENMLALYHLNNLIDKGHLTKILREEFNMPRSGITSEMVAKNKNWSGWVAGDGTIYAASRYCQLDYRWTLVMVFYYYYKLLPQKKHHFVPPTMPVLNASAPKQAKIAIIGDFGTGPWNDGGKLKCPAELVIEGVLAQKPDYIIHLGDVYYAGTPKEEKKNLLNMLPESYKNKVYTMNSNHEMYDGAKGLLGETLQNPRFSQQGGSSCFSLSIGEWIFVGLDSAYYDESFLYMKGSLCNKDEKYDQLGYLNTLYQTGKKIFLMTHHNGIEVDKDGPKTNTPLWTQVTGAMANNVPDAWYWGHVHNGIVYRDDLSIYNVNPENPKTSKMRCCGHASIPFGNASYLESISSGANPDVLYYANTKMPDPKDEVQKLRTINGFAIIEISGDTMTEAFYEVSNVNPTPKKVLPLA